MTLRLIIAAALLAAGGPALASPCLDRINALDKRLDEAAQASASTSSGGQGVAASRESKAMQSRNENAPTTGTKVPPFQDQAREAQTTRRAADEAHGGGDGVMQGRAFLNEARAMEQKGDSAGCLAKISEAEGRLSPR